MNPKVYDTIIIGGGPAGCAAAVYTARKKLRTLLLTEDFAGQSISAAAIENWIGDRLISGIDLAKKLENHVRAYPEIDIITSAPVVAVSEASACFFDVVAKGGEIFRTRSIIAAAGARRRRLGVPGEAELEGRGVAFCSTCDAPFFQDSNVAVVGSGNAALETVIDLLPFAKDIYLLLRGDNLKGDAVTRDRATSSPRVTLITNVVVEAILGEKSVTGLSYRDIGNRELRELSVDGVFVEIGSVPNSEFLRDLVATNESGEITVDHKTAETSKPGIFAAGDVTSDPFKQNNIAAGDGIRAALSAYNHVLNIKKHSPCAESL
ncbi:MAG: FAD-dependent oxidoreductase [Deltaproteobacteria bacterium]|nr:FAD-dependent oxidoreductase [Deltaproteobacteria bacterium]